MDLETKESEKFIIAIIAWSICTLLILFKYKKLSILLNDLKNKAFLITLLFVTAFTIYCWHSSNEMLKLASQKASVALLIAYLSRLDMVFTAYFIIFIFAYYTSGDIV